MNSEVFYVRKAKFEQFFNTSEDIDKIFSVQPRLDIQAIGTFILQYTRQKNKNKEIMLNAINFNIVPNSTRISKPRDQQALKLRGWLDKTKHLKDKSLVPPLKISCIEKLKSVDTIVEKSQYSQSVKKYPNFHLAFIPDEPEEHPTQEDEAKE